MKNLVFDQHLVAHRGASAYAPENTMLAFKKAFEMGAKWIEFDVMLAACGTPVIIHDETLDRTTNGKGFVHEYTFTKLSQLDAGSWFNSEFASARIPSLVEVLNFIADTNISVNIELKPLPGSEHMLISKVLPLVNKFKFRNEQILYSSFAIEALHVLTKVAPNVQIGLLLHEWLENWHDLSPNCISVHLNDEIITKEIIGLIKQANKQVLSYTVNNKARADLLINWGVDAVFSDNLLQKVV